MPSKLSKRSKPLHIALKIIIGLTIATSLLLAGTYVALSGDEAPPDIADLKLTYRDIPPDKNAYALLTVLSEKVPDPYRDLDDETGDLVEGMVNGDTPWDDVLATRLLAGTDQLWPELAQALSAPENQAPQILSYADLLPEVGAIRRLARLAALHAQQLAINGSQIESLELTENIVRLGHSLETSQGSILTWLTGRAIGKIARDAIHTIELTVGYDDTSARRLIEILGTYPPNRDGLIDAYKVEFQVFTNELERLYRSTNQERYDLMGDSQLPKFLGFGPMLPLTFKLNKTKRIYADHLRVIIALADEPTIREIERTQATERLLSDIRVTPYRLENTVGRIFVSIIVPVYRSVLKTQSQSLSDLSATQALLAVRAYQRDHDGQLPATLDALVPAYLPAVPLDYYDREPIRYSREFRAIWSLGRKGEYTVTSADQPADEEEIDLRIP